MKKRITLLLVFLIFFSQSSLAQASSPGTSGSNALKFPVGGRAIGMGDAFTGLANDVTSIYWNPAGLSNLSTREFAASYVDGVLDVSHTFLGYAQETKWGYLGGGISLLRAGDATINNSDGTTMDVTAGQEYVITLAYAGKEILPGVSLGGNLKLISSKLAEKESANSFCTDWGAFYQPKVKDLTLGFSLLNLGGKMKYKDEGDPLPLTVRLGAAYRYEIKPEHGLILATDLVKPNDNGVRLNLGAEYSYQGYLCGRLGYKTGYDSEGLACGIGVIYQGYRLDYTYSPVEDLESGHRLSLIYGF